MAADDQLGNPSLSQTQGGSASLRSPAPLGQDAEFSAQLDEVRVRLLRDAGAAGFDDAIVTQTLADAVRSYEEASVRSFLAVLIERDVRQRLELRATGPAAPEPA